VRVIRASELREQDLLAQLQESRLSVHCVESEHGDMVKTLTSRAVQAERALKQVQAELALVIRVQYKKIESLASTALLVDWQSFDRSERLARELRGATHEVGVMRQQRCGLCWPFSRCCASKDP
jgi:hypothetical protein